MRAFFLFPVLLWLAAGCGDGDIHRNPLMLKGDRYRSEGNPELAEKFYRRLVERKPDSGPARLALATLYDEALDNPAAALYMYDEFLRLEPDSPDRPAVEGYRRMAAAKLRRKLAYEALPTPPADQLEELRAENEAMRRQLAFQKRYILEQQKRLDALSAAANAPRQTPRRQESGPGEERFYTVRSGDTPGEIARRFYGSAAEYRRILKANNLTDSTGLRIGQKLKIPPIE